MPMYKLKDAEQLMQEIDTLFPLTALPEIKTLTVHSKDCFDCEHVQDDFKAYRDS